MAFSLNMTPYQRFQLIFEKWFQFTSTAIGLNILDKDFQFSLASLFIVTLVTSVLISSVYTMFAFDTEAFFKGTTCFSLGLQAFSKVYTVATKRTEIRFLSSFVENIHVVNEKKPSKRIRDIMDECSLHNFLITVALLSLYFLCVIIFLLFPVLMFAIFQMKEPWLPLYLLGIDFNTKEGFVVTSIYHCVVLYMTGIGFGFNDALFSNLVFNVFIMSKLQCNQLSTLDDELNADRPHELKIRTRLANFFLMNLEMEKYIELINDTYFWMIFVQIMTSSLCTTLIVYVIMTMTWYPAYFLAVCCVFQLFVFCALGTVIEVAILWKLDTFLLKKL
ncbi:odorant receptor 67d-like [Sitodiplosis mosellana]|uniref:odorant receptor 67d-like n=1 Tax=Sitodiplosis mosellana TaxID=263140 RepID=UPI002444D45D|nr:odorant receptor 67d-like [Sitodiplosis mosellana]